jgi:hypothetical protein
MTTVSNTVDEAAKLIRARISELDAERAKLERALAGFPAFPQGRQPDGAGAAAAEPAPSRP